MHKSAVRYLLFRAGGCRFAVNVDTVDEVAEMLPEYPIPGAPRFLRGVVNIHGKIAASLDLSLYTGTGPVKHGRNLLLLRMPETALAVVAEELERMISADEILSEEPAESEFSSATLTLADGRAALLAVEPLVASVEKALAQ
jgi:chemotaxis signal transduction protein